MRKRKRADSDSDSDIPRKKQKPASDSRPTSPKTERTFVKLTICFNTALAVPTAPSLSPAYSNPYFVHATGLLLVLFFTKENRRYRSF